MKALNAVVKMRRTAAIGQLINAAECLAKQDLYGPNGILRGQAVVSNLTLARRFPRAAKILDTKAAAVGLHGTNFACATAALLAPRRRSVRITTSALSLAVGWLERQRNPYGRDGSDQMQQVIHQYGLLTQLLPSAQREDAYLRAVNAQLAISYTASGVIKLVSDDWRSGRAFGLVMRTAMYGDARVARLVERFPALGKTVCWQTIAWETCYPLTYVMPHRAAKVALAGAKMFHTAIGVSMGLPRFMWAFGATHPAADYVVQQRGQIPASRAKIEQGAAAVFLTSLAGVAGMAALDRMRHRQIRSGGLVSETLSLDEGGQVEYRALPCGRPGAPVVVFENGLGAAMESWDWVAAEVRRKADVVLYHRSGYGASSAQKPPEELVDAILKAQGWDEKPLVLVGHSMGGMAARRKALDGSNSPEAVVLVDSADPSLLDSLGSAPERVGKVRQAMFLEFLGSLVGTSLLMHPGAGEVDYRNTTQQLVSRFTRQLSTARAAMRELETYLDQARALDEPLEADVHVIAAEHGTEGTTAHTADQEAMAKRLGGTYATVAGAAHRSVIGDQRFAGEVTQHVLRVVDTCTKERASV